MRVLDLFSGIGGFSLGLERAGMRTVAFCEIDPFCRRVLAKHWPDVPCYDDVRTLTSARLASDGIAIDAICGGFPCQDISSAGKREGIDGERSGLWKDYARIIGEVRPQFVVVENVAALLSRGLDVVLGDLAALGFDAEWHCIPACAVGAGHERDRIWIVAYPERGGLPARILQHDLSNAIQPTPTHRGRFGYPLGPTWHGEPQLAVMVHGLPDDMDGSFAIGNAVVPQIPEIIGRAIMKASSPHLTAEMEGRT
jgi:DNA (cytosine-5)-methyltransferase 1